MDVSLARSAPIRHFLPSFAPSKQREIPIASFRSIRARKSGGNRHRIVALLMQSSSPSSPPPIPPGDALVLVPGDGAEAPSRWLAPFSAALDAERSVWLWFGDLPPSAPLPDAVLPALSAACSAAAHAGQPMADFVPLVPRLAAEGGGRVWRVLGGGESDENGSEVDEDENAAPSSPDSSPRLASVLVGSEEQRERASELARRVQRAAAQQGPSSSAAAAAAAAAAVPVLVVEPPRAAFPASLPAAVPAAAVPDAAATNAGADSPPSPPFDQVAVGGTFDRLHAGHRLLLAASALAAERRLFIGITGDKLLSNKKHAELLQPFEERASAAVAFARKVRPGRGFLVEVGALLDPKEPTGAETEAGMQALVVSNETVSGGEAINDGRRARGFRPLALLVVGLVGSSGGEEGEEGEQKGNEGARASDEIDGKISSTELRAAEAARKKE